MRTPALGGLAAILVATAASTAAAIADDRVATQLERGAFVAAPAVYDVTSHQRIDALVVDKRRIPIGRNVPIRGTAFGVAPGRVVAAQHVVAPSRRQLIEEIVAVAGLSATTDPARVRVIARTPRTVSLVPPAATASAVSPRHIPARVKRRSSEVNDLALLSIADLDAPTLALNDTLTRGTPVAVIGFGAQPPAVPAVRLGTLDGPRVIKGTENDGFGGFEGEVLRGDSGAPIVDAHGQAHGVVLRVRTDTAPVIARAESVRALLEADGASGGESTATADFRTAMATFWRRDYVTAAASLKLLRDADPDGAIVSHEYERATALVASGYALHSSSRTRGAILAIGVMAAVCAGALGGLRIRRQPFLP